MDSQSVVTPLSILSLKAQQWFALKQPSAIEHVEIL